MKIKIERVVFSIMGCSLVLAGLYLSGAIQSFMTTRSILFGIGGSMAFSVIFDCWQRYWSNCANH